MELTYYSLIALMQIHSIGKFYLILYISNGFYRLRSHFDGQKLCILHQKLNFVEGNEHFDSFSLRMVYISIIRIIIYIVSDICL